MKITLRNDNAYLILPEYTFHTQDFSNFQPKNMKMSNFRPILGLFWARKLVFQIFFGIFSIRFGFPIKFCIRIVFEKKFRPNHGWTKNVLIISYVDIIKAVRNSWLSNCPILRSVTK